MMFRMMPGALGEEPVRLIYPELLKRLDDSNDTVRMAVCGTIAAFFRVSEACMTDCCRVNSCGVSVVVVDDVFAAWSGSVGHY